MAVFRGGSSTSAESTPTHVHAHTPHLRYEPPALEYREVYGVGFAQRRNAREITLSDVATDAVSGGPMPEAAQRDLVLAAITAKYTQSNSICFAVLFAARVSPLTTLPQWP